MDFRYLRGSSNWITFGNGKPMLVGYTDSDLAGNKDNMKSTSGYLMTFAGGAVSWQSRLQKCVALSTTEAEYVKKGCVQRILWLKRFLQELGFKQQRYAVLCDNQMGYVELIKFIRMIMLLDLLAKAKHRESEDLLAHSQGWRTHPHRRIWGEICWVFLRSMRIKRPTHWGPFRSI
ncbi:hypothetical protein Tco_0754439 [Tanacetum coccineum]